MMSDQIRIPCVVIRGGSSKGIYIKVNDLPRDPAMRDRMILAIFGSPDRRQIDGLAGAEPLTSKLAIVGSSSRPDADVDYTFGQVSTTDAIVDYGGNCGNISSGVGPFAIDESMVQAVEPVTRVRIYNTNTDKIIVADVQVKDGKARVTGDCVIAGVPGSSAPILLDFAGTAGAVTGKTLPTGKPVDVIETSRGQIEASIVDVANPCIFVHARSVGMVGTELPEDIDGNPELLAYLEELRARCAVIIGMAETMEEASGSRPAIPMLAFVAESQEYVSYNGKIIYKEDVDLVSRLMYMQILHKAYAGSCTACTGVAAKISGTIVNRVLSVTSDANTIRIGHPSGVLPVMAAVENNVVTRASLFRTARRIMEGYAFIEKSRLENSNTVAC